MKCFNLHALLGGTYMVQSLRKIVCFGPFGLLKQNAIDWLGGL